VALAAAAGRLSFLALLVAAGAAAGTASSSTLSSIRACPSAQFDRHEDVCRVDRSGRPFTATLLYCSAHVDGSPGVVRGHFVYRGVALRSVGGRVSPPTDVDMSATFGPRPIPGGLWACDMRFGQAHVRRSFVLRGPVGPALYSFVCLDANAARVPSGQGPCRANRHRPFRPRDVLMCTVTITSRVGALIRADLVREGVTLPPPYRARAISAISTMHYYVTTRRRRVLQPGHYACVWSLNGREVARTPFVVAR
jgi:hypothetical protein